MQLTAIETARRLRAMWGYSMLEQEAFIAELGVDREAGRRMLRRTTPTKAAEGVLERAAEVSGFPKSLALEGIDTERPTVVERVEAVERRIDAFLEALRRSHEGGDLADDLVAIYEEHGSGDPVDGAGLEHVATEREESPARSDPPDDPSKRRRDDRPGRAAHAAERQ